MCVCVCVCVCRRVGMFRIPSVVNFEKEIEIKLIKNKQIIKFFSND